MFTSRQKLPFIFAVLIALTALSLSACGDDDGTSSTQTDVQLTNFAADRARITVGTGVNGDAIQGTVTFSWTVEGADQVRLLADSDEVDLSACAPTGGSSCADGGSITLSPTKDTIYTLEASQSGADCSTNSAACQTREVAILISPPATASLDTDVLIVPPLSDVAVQYQVQNSDDWQIGLVSPSGFTPCEPQSTASATAPCTLPEEGGEVAMEGEVIFSGVTDAFTVGVLASGVAPDRLGDIKAGDVEVSVEILGDPTIVSFEAEDTTVRPGDVVTLTWETLAAESLEVTIDPPGAATADDVTACNSAGIGSCEVTMLPGASGDVVFVAIARGLDNKTSAPRTQRITVGDGPTIDVFEVSPLELPRVGGDVSVIWQSTDGVHLRIELEGADAPLVDTAESVGGDLCTGGACDVAAGELAGITVTENSVLKLSAINEFGATVETASITVEGGPRLTLVEVDGVNALSTGVVAAAGDTGELSWETADAESTTLEQAVYPIEGCGQVPQWEATPGFSAGTSGAHTLEGLAEPTCVRISANAADNVSHSVVFAAVKQPTIDFFSTSEAISAAGGEVTLSWGTTDAASVSLTVDPPESVSSDGLAGCNAVNAGGDGSCQVQLEPLTPVGDVVFSLTAHAVIEDATSAPSMTSLQVGLAPTIATFAADPPTLAATGDVTLSWTISDGQQLEIIDSTGASVFSTSDAATINDGSFIVTGVSQTTTWTIEADNAFGPSTATTTTFFGPSVDAFNIDGVSALSGSVSVPTGDLPIDWTTANTDDVELSSAAVPASGSCADVMVADWVVEATGTSADSATLSAVGVDTCVRLSASNSGGQSSELLAQIDELPDVVALATDVDSFVVEDGGDVVVSADVTGAVSLTITAQYLDDQGTPIENRVVCDESSLDSGAVADDTTPQSISCTHANAPYDCVIFVGCTPAAGSAPAGTATVHYVVNAIDSEGDAITIETDAANDVSGQ